ncbi:MAG: ATP-binding protein [Nitrospirae bacterium]|nr:ATP-binding protein [Nitrospirota bacterium]
MKSCVVLTIPSDPQYLKVIRAVAGQVSIVAGMSVSEVDEVRSAVDEACSNVMKYAYRGNTERKIVVQFRIIKDKFEVIIEDDGIKASPEAIKGRDLDDIRPGGLGIHLIKRAFDSMSFDKRKKRGNRLKLIKHTRG